MNDSDKKLIDSLVEQGAIRFHQLALEQGITFDSIKANPKLVMKITNQVVEQLGLKTSLDVPTKRENPITSIARWFRVAKPKPNLRDKATQIGCHFEEVFEMLDAVNGYNPELKHIADYWKSEYGADNLANIDHEELLDALCDQIVTAIGVAHMMGYDIEGALSEVAESNWSKAEGDTFLYDGDGKIKKGKDYRPPNLKPFLNKQ